MNGETIRNAKKAAKEMKMKGFFFYSEEQKRISSILHPPQRHVNYCIVDGVEHEYTEWTDTRHPHGTWEDYIHHSSWLWKVFEIGHMSRAIRRHHYQRENMEERDYKVGMIVTRDGTDRHEIIEIDYGYGSLTVKCIKEPFEKWIKIGETEHNLIRRYSIVT